MHENCYTERTQIGITGKSVDNFRPYTPEFLIVCTAVTKGADVSLLYHYRETVLITQVPVTIICSAKNAEIIPCAEEFLWRTKRRIPGDVWKVWRSGMIENLKIPQVKDLYLEETSSVYGKASYYGLYEELRIR